MPANIMSLCLKISLKMHQKISGCKAEDFRIALSAERSGSHLAPGQDYTGDDEVTPTHIWRF